MVLGACVDYEAMMVVLCTHVECEVEVVLYDHVECVVTMVLLCARI
jgi:hypothetical protein